jgi:hypothetical protein
MRGLFRRDEPFDFCSTLFRSPGVSVVLFLFCAAFSCVMIFVLLPSYKNESIGNKINGMLAGFFVSVLIAVILPIITGALWDNYKKDKEMLLMAQSAALGYDDEYDDDYYDDRRPPPRRFSRRGSYRRGGDNIDDIHVPIMADSLPPVVSSVAQAAPVASVEPVPVASQPEIHQNMPKATLEATLEATSEVPPAVEQLTNPPESRKGGKKSVDPYMN